MHLFLRLVLAVAIALGGLLPSSVSMAVDAPRDHHPTTTVHTSESGVVVKPSAPCHGAPTKPVDQTHCFTVLGTCCALEQPMPSATAPAFTSLPVVWRVHTDVAVVAWAFEPATPPPRI